MANIQSSIDKRSRELQRLDTKINKVENEVNNFTKYGNFYISLGIQRFLSINWSIKY